MSNFIDPFDHERRYSLHKNIRDSRFIVVMGVSGTGKSTLGAALSEALHLPFIDGDDLHPSSNVAKMSRGEPLNDADRQPWLDIIRNTAAARILAQLGVRVDHGEEDDIEPVEKPTRDTTWTDSEYERRVSGSAREDIDERRPGVIIACSSLKKTYRAVLRGDSEGATRMAAASDRGGTSGLDAFSLPTYFVYMKGDRDVLMDRMQQRKGHFMKAGMLESQLNTLESPEGELGVVTVSVELTTQEQVRKVVEFFRSQGR